MVMHKVDLSLHGISCQTFYPETPPLSEIIAKSIIHEKISFVISGSWCQPSLTSNIWKIFMKYQVLTVGKLLRPHYLVSGTNIFFKGLVPTNDDIYYKYTCYTVANWSKGLRFDGTKIWLNLRYNQIWRSTTYLLTEEMKINVT